MHCQKQRGWTLTPQLKAGRQWYVNRGKPMIPDLVALGRGTSGQRSAIGPFSGFDHIAQKTGYAGRGYRGITTPGRLATTRACR